jgi:23S rRNA (cytosine1962-C5)-methyltransferase
VVRQLAGLPVKGRGARRRDYPRFEPRHFGIVVLDPPRWAKSPFGAIDLVRDYPSLLKPSLLATASGGSLLVTNNAARVDRDEWLRVVHRTAEKSGRRLAAIDIIEPEEDFPSIDEAPPLKMAWLRLA